MEKARDIEFAHDIACMAYNSNVRLMLINQYPLVVNKGC